MSNASNRRDTARAERIVPGIWRLRIPLDWPGVPHVNAYALSAGEKVVLVDTGTALDGDLQQLEFAFSQIGRGIEDISLVVCTHAHVDHYGLARAVVDASGAPFWIHPKWRHIEKVATDPAASRREVAEISGVPAEEFQRYEDERGDEVWLSGLVEPTVDLLPGVTVQSDLGDWHVHETPGHAPSHVVLHQPERRLLLSGDHLLGRVSLFFDYGHTPDPIAEFLASLDRINELDVGLVLSGHGRPFRDPGAKIVATREMVADGITRIQASLAAGPATAYEVMRRIAGTGEMPPVAAIFVLQVILSNLDHLHLQGVVARDDAGGPAPVWSLAA